ncbi:hypothetical protein CPB83DRAFT_888040 [Crepidotus variabilis]|uniref:Chitin-binding type-3 domain-containing protein n=1 Tax=Crepidotus variabilis TaxID=179855 RepID=A0A9P6JX21_9AGAR|nr:hypothetical protein CPB83DRAFT_888040 [Crepidotus variabilis]
MVQQWEPGTQYNLGDVVQYEGHRYKIIQPHRSQGDWAPSVTPALWGRLSDQDNNYGGGDHRPQQNQGYQPQYQQPQQQQHQQQPVQQQPPPQYNQHQQDQKTDHQGDDQKHWYEDHDTKKKIGIGAGIIGGSALLAGAGLLAGGVYAYKKHEEHKKEDEQRDERGEDYDSPHRRY